jgi:hypothetical protein
MYSRPSSYSKMQECLKFKYYILKTVIENLKKLFNEKSYKSLLDLHLVLALHHFHIFTERFNFCFFASKYSREFSCYKNRRSLQQAKKKTDSF